MNDVTGYPIANITGGGAADGGNRAHFTFEFDGGDRRTFLCDPFRLNEFIDKLSRIAGLCHQERLKRDPTYQQTDRPEEASIKRVIQWEIGIDFGKRAIVLGGRHPDGTVTHLPIQESDLQELMKELRRSRDELRAGNKPKAH